MRLCQEHRDLGPGGLVGREVGGETSLEKQAFASESPGAGQIETQISYPHCRQALDQASQVLLALAYSFQVETLLLPAFCPFVLRNGRAAAGDGVGCCYP